MKKKLILLVVVFVLLCAPVAAAQADGTIVENEPCPANPSSTFEQYVEAEKKSYAEEIEEARQEGFTMSMPANFTDTLLDRKEFERRKAYRGFECRRIKYLSDGLKVVGFIWKPKSTEGKKLPLIIYNRGGVGDYGKLTPWVREGFYYFLEQGFTVIGSQYRGNDGGEGKEESGGADVRDVVNLIPLARSLGYVDMNNVFMWGQSRGGMMTYLALRNNVAVNAAATTGGIADLFAMVKRRPIFLERVYPQLIPGFNKHPEESLRERSAVYFADRINTPLLLMQGTADWRVDAGSNALVLAQKLQEHGKTYQLIVYSKDDHQLTLNRADRDKGIVEWFKKYMK